MEELKAREAKVLEDLRKAHNMFDYDLVLDLTAELREVRKEIDNYSYKGRSGKGRTWDAYGVR